MWKEIIEKKRWIIMVPIVMVILLLISLEVYVDIKSQKIDEEYEDLIKFFRNQSVKDPTDLAAVSFRVQCYIDVKDFDNAEKLCSLLSDELKNPLLEEINKAKTGGTE